MKKLWVGGIIFLELVTIFFFIGGIGYRQVIAQDMGVFAGLFLFILALVLNQGKLKLPPYFWLYMGFATLVGWDVITRGNPFYSPKFFSLMVGGGFFWTAFYLMGRGKYREVINQYFPISLLVLGYVFFVGYVWMKSIGYDLEYFSFSILYPLSREHHHIGVYWSLVLLTLLPFLPRDNKYPWYMVVTILLGAYLVIISQARSALLALLVGTGIYFKDRLLDFQDKNKNVRIFILMVIAAILLISVYKPVRLMHFFTPGILTLERLPLGIGVGKFREASGFYAYKFESIDFITTSSHNLFMEMIAGLGWLGFIFLVWFILVSKTLFYKKDSRSKVSMVLFLSLSAVFVVDPGYTIPTLYWLWMSLLGVVQGSREVE